MGKITLKNAEDDEDEVRNRHKYLIAKRSDENISPEENQKNK